MHNSKYKCHTAACCTYHPTNSLLLTGKQERYKKAYLLRKTIVNGGCWWAKWTNRLCRPSLKENWLRWCWSFVGGGFARFQTRSGSIGVATRKWMDKCLWLAGWKLVSWCFKPSQPRRITSRLRETFTKRHVAERTNEADTRPEEQSEKAESPRENSWNKMQLKGPLRIDTRTE